MTTTPFAIGALVLALSVGEIFGDIRLGDRYLADAPVELKCGAETVKAKTDSAGSFRLAVKASGKCTFSVTHGDKSASIDVVVFNQPARYRLVLELKDGVYVLRRV
jgi:hypothetical protein